MQQNKIAPASFHVPNDAGAVLVREAGVPFWCELGAGDPFVEWLSLMEVVQMLCPAWPVREAPMLGNQWKL
ncbi:MAG: hypothetical protein HC765_15460 [Brachymonas sp.]|nr:hypothetical protein [Brachymonas sp.]